jgi:hypothetical protein
MLFTSSTLFFEDTGRIFADKFRRHHLFTKAMTTQLCRTETELETGFINTYIIS